MGYGLGVAAATDGAREERVEERHGEGQLKTPPTLVVNFEK
jgi:hypothetical protein